ncbi:MULTISPECIES: substrate-binding domain-containing protein [Paraburkholderia]|uniref:substrate-binding domain-containing protein n=1 Tax=Paraburkholderia TaxID=1822464 RepID=UPI002250523B|nr:MULTISPECIES: substrate-binding domain-containing protein [Paraburkholderia]MCX4170819.1 substrate-binding domain-containing protein [Paraburkholderia madseniana]MDQ6458831.1 substrate-binding domain-containing protein [Paraburkholderia madseniana]
MKQLFRYSTYVLAAGLLAGTASSAALAADSISVQRQGDITSMCGTKPMVVGLSDGYGGNTWRKTAIAELKDEVGRCKNLKRFIYTNANGDQQKANSDINSMVAQGVNVLIVYPDFGAAQLPAMRAATRAGVTVIPYMAEIPGTPGKDYAANVSADLLRIGGAWADWFGQNLKNGNVVFLGGIPGAPASQTFLDGFKTHLAKYPGLKLVQNDFVVTNWNPIDAPKAVEGVIAKYSHIDGVAADYGVTALATVKTFQQAHLPIPAIATGSSNNELSCKYVAMKEAGKPFPYYSLDGMTSVIRFAARRGVAMYQGTTDNEPLKVFPYTYADSGAGVAPKCDTSAPPDADFSSVLAADKLKAVFKQ